ncbi:MAG: hypothetical protein ABSA79_01040 [Candidatus Bathyarchaeia archaeon]|jgi:hypothetical protein
MSKEQNDFKTDIEKLHESLSCQHCRHNEKGQEPFDEMKQIKLTPLADKALQQTAKQFCVEPDCVLCLSVQSFLKLPWNKQLDLLKGKN